MLEPVTSVPILALTPDASFRLAVAGVKDPVRIKRARGQRALHRNYRSLRRANAPLVSTSSRVVLPRKLQAHPSETVIGASQRPPPGEAHAVPSYFP